MTREAIAAKVTAIAVEHLGVSADKVTQDARFTEDLNCDSLDLVELVMAFEDDLGIQIADDESEKVETVKDLTDLLFSKVHGK